jgi:hypothetical protein
VGTAPTLAITRAVWSSLAVASRVLLSSIATAVTRSV